MLKTRLEQVIPERRNAMDALLAEHGNEPVGTVTVEQIIRGGRDVTSVFCDTSEVPSDRGLMIRGTPIAELADRSPEEIFWLLTTGELPRPDQHAWLTAELNRRGAKVPSHVFKIIDSVPRTAHPMRTFILAVNSLGAPCGDYHGSAFARSAASLPKDRQWEPMLEDCLNLLAATRVIAAYIYRLRFGKGVNEWNEVWRENMTGPYASGFAHMLGIPELRFVEFLRLYLVLQCDHEGGNASAHASLLTGSTFADIYYSYASGMCALAGPRHGLAAQECLEWVLAVQQHFGSVPTESRLAEYVSAKLKGGEIIPGYGHARLRSIDPRFQIMLAAGKQLCPENPLLQIVEQTFKVTPGIMREMGKAKNPAPNTDAVPGSIAHYLGLQELDFYTVLFAVSRAFGLCAQAIDARALGLPIERPNSISLRGLLAAVQA